MHATFLAEWFVATVAMVSPAVVVVFLDEASSFLGVAWLALCYNEGGP